MRELGLRLRRLPEALSVRFSYILAESFYISTQCFQTDGWCFVKFHIGSETCSRWVSGNSSMNWPFDSTPALPSQLTWFIQGFLFGYFLLLDSNFAVCALKTWQLLQEDSVPTCGSCMHHLASMSSCHVSDFQICMGAIKPWFTLPKISLSQLACSQVPIMH